MSTDAYEFFDAAYLMGALSEDERLAYEEHLQQCDACCTRVEEARGVFPYLIASEEGDLTESYPPLPDTVLPHLLARARRTSRRRRTVGIAIGVVAASLLAVTIGLTTHRSDNPIAHPMVAVRSSAVNATASLRQTSWGTEITVNCGYAPGVAIPAGYRYALSVRSRTGAITQLGNWQLNDGRSITFSAGTALPISQIQAIDITDSDGTPLLELTGPPSSQSAPAI